MTSWIESVLLGALAIGARPVRNSDDVSQAKQAPGRSGASPIVFGQKPKKNLKLPPVKTA
jgi:hypothetical protein